MQHFIVGGIGRSGTTVMATGLSMHPSICCFVEQPQHFRVDHTGLFDDRERLLAARSVHAETNRRLLEGKTHLEAFGNKFPGYVHRWQGVLSEIGPETRALVMIRDPRGVLASWEGRRSEGTFPLTMIPAYGAFDFFEMIRQAIEGPFAAQTMFVSYSTFLYGDRCGEIFDRCCKFLGVTEDVAARAKFVRQEANSAYTAKLPRSSLNGAEENLLAALPYAKFLAEIDSAGCLPVLDSQEARPAVEAFKTDAAEIFECVEACFDSPRALEMRPGHLNERLANADPLIVMAAGETEGPLAEDIRQAAKRHRRGSRRMRRRSFWARLLPRRLRKTKPA